MAGPISPDGRIRAIAHPAGGGVFLRADFSNLAPRPRRVRFVRSETRIPVRSGHDAWAPGGIAVAYDREAPGGVASAWYAIPIYRTATGWTEGQISQGADIIAPSVDRDRDFWLKSIATPLQLRLSARLPLPERVIEGDTAGQKVPGSAFLAGGYDVPTNQQVTYIFRTHTLAEYQELDQLVRSGPMLVQALGAYGISDEYFRLARMSSAYMITARDPRRTVTLALTPCQRPPTEHAPLFVPGHSWADGRRAYRSWADGKARVASWDQLLITAPPVPPALIPETGGGTDEGTL